MIKQAFTDSGNFQSQTAEAHRLYYKTSEHGTAYPIDLIPFGKIASPAHTISWPPDMAVVMNVAGYTEALKHAIEVNVGDGLIVNVISIPALAAIKLFAWDDRGLQDNKDAQDVLFLLINYHAAGNAGRLSDEASSLLEGCGFDFDLAGAALLGYDTRLILEESTTQAILAILGDPRKRDRLTVHMARSLNIDSSIPTPLLASSNWDSVWSNCSAVMETNKKMRGKSLSVSPLNASRRMNRPA